AVEQVDGPGHDEVERVGVVTRAVDGLVLPERDLAEEAGGLRAPRRAEVAERGLREEGLPGAGTQHDGATTMVHPTGRSSRASALRRGWSGRAHRCSARGWRRRDRGNAGSRSTRGRAAPPGPRDHVAPARGPRGRWASRSRASGGPGRAVALAPSGCRA